MAKSRARKLADLIVGAGIDIDGNLTFDGGSTSADLTFADGDKANFGDASDLQIYHDGSSNLIQGSNGSLYIQAKAGENSILASPDGGVNLYHDNSLKFETTSTGVKVTGNLTANDNQSILLGTGSDLSIFHDGTDSFIKNDTGQLILRVASVESALVAVPNGAVSLYYDNSAKLATTSTGIQVTGNIDFPSSATILSGGTNTDMTIGTSVSGSTGLLKLQSTGDIQLFQYGTSWTTNVTFKGDGQVGIGTTSPQSFVESSRFVVGSGTSGTNEMMFLYSGTDAFGAIGFADGTSGTERYRGTIGYHHDGDEMFFSTNGGGEADRDVTITSAGNVGIGTTSPGAKLDIVESYDNTFLKLSYSSSDSGAADYAHYSELLFQGGGSYNKAGVRSYANAYSTGNAALAFWTQEHAGSYAERMRIIGNGNVGIGTTSPDADLHIAGTNDNNLIIQNTTYQASNQDTEAAIRFKVTASADAERAKAGIHFKNDGSEYGRGDLYFTVDSNNDNGNVDINDSKMIITHEGNVGIGNTNPNLPLTITSNSGANGLALRARSNDDYSFIQFFNNAGSAVRGQIYNHNGNIGFTTGTDTSAGNDLYIKDGVGVGIGTTNPQTALHIYDTPAEIVRMQGNDEFAYASFYGTVSASEARLGYLGFANDTSTAADFNFANNQGGIFSFNAGIETVGTVHNDSTQVGFKHTAHGVATGNTNKHSFQIGRWIGSYNRWMMVPETEGTPTYQKEFGFDFEQNGWFVEGTFTTDVVGVGTSSPRGELEIESTGVTNLYLTRNDATINDTNSLGVVGFSGTEDGSTYIDGAQVYAKAEVSWSSGDYKTGLAFATNSGNSLIERMRIKHDGKVAIGGASAFSGTPENTLSLIHDGHGLGFDYVGATLPRTAGLFTSSSALTQTAYGDLNIKARTDYGNYYGIGFFTAAANNTPVNRMIIKANGNVGIGTTDPSEKLHVAGSVLFGPAGSYSRSDNGVGINFTSNHTYAANGDPGDSNRYFSITNDSTTANAYAPLSFRVNPNGGDSNAMADIKLVSNGSSHHLTTTIRNPATLTFVDALSIRQDGNVRIGDTDGVYNTSSTSYIPVDTNGRFLTISNDTGAFLNLQSEANTAQQLGGILWTNRTGAADAHRQVAGIDATTVDTTNTFEGGQLRFWTKIAGSANTQPGMIITHTRIVKGNDSEFLGFEDAINILNADPEDGGSDFDQTPTNLSDGGGTTWSISNDGDAIYFSSTSGGHGGTWMHVYCDAGLWAIKGSVRLTNTDGAIHPITSSDNYKFTHSFRFYIDSGPDSGTLKWDADAAASTTGTDFTRAAFSGTPVYMSGGYKTIKYQTNGYNGVQRIYITDLQLVKVG